MKDIMYYLTFGRRYLAVGAVAFISGTYTALNQNITAKNAAGIYIFAAFFAFAIIFAFVGAAIILRRRREIRSRIFCVLLISAVFICGHVLAAWRIARFDSDAADLAEQQVLYCGVLSEPKISSSGKSYGFQCEVLKAERDGEEKTYERRPKILVYIRADEPLPKIGDVISVGHILTFDGRRSGFDYTSYMRQKDVCFSCFSGEIGISDYSGSEYKQPWLMRAGQSFRREILNSDRAYPYKAEELSLLQGILIGSTESFSEEHYDRLADSGFMHIAAVSGLHISYLVMFLSVILGTLRFPKQLSALLIAACLVLFAAAAGFTPSVCRAVIMMSIFLAASGIMRPYDGITALAAAALSLVVCNPYNLNSAGFILSFGATLGILVFYKPMYNAAFSVISKTGGKIYLSQMRNMASKALHGLIKFGLSSICVSLSASIGLLYPMMKIFGTIQWGSIIGNMAAIPLTAVVFIGGMATAALYPVIPAAAYFTAAYFVNPSLWLINRLSEVFSKPIYRITTAAPPKSFFIIYIVVCIGLYLLLIPCEDENTAKIKSAAD
ncbi:MAG: ComEC/Rec2 family competence protein [Clostridia bacterium]|nr:ComEC/Rec2 family competence protein [Clostridia bacterium]